MTHHLPRPASTVLACTLVWLALPGPPLTAQQSTTRGFNLGAHFQAASYTIERQDPEQAGGFGVRVGYGFNRIVTAYLGIDGAKVELTDPTVTGDWQLAHVDLGVRFHFANSLRRWVPYLDAALGGRAVTVKDAIVNGNSSADVSLNGAAFSLGGGLYVFFNESLALDLGVKASSGEFNTLEVGALSLSNLDLDVKSTRVNLGIAWWM
jgi:opacity protein-like surface antigen